ncbi:TonB-dependent receptor domain-containing protein [Flavihumibacter stibioxidans]|uniref:TonB-dependent receptor n=1 Tax=Flavihumibacter stibioxidans TaxID=1834163 RepID=A0ABR7MCI6_9BACT|nr:TonB-dependent receptor [Flavihumibacter stibioxidans]MBC6492219.1 hypothetical protein [Flavihumibacter stibioxidans]
MAACLVLGISANAQKPEQLKIKISGIVKDARTSAPVASATISSLTVISTGSNTTDTISNLSITDQQGYFLIVVPEGSYSMLTVSAIGFEPLDRKINFTAGRNEINAGDFILSNEATSLANVVVTAKKPLMSIGVDRRIFNADAAITSKGGNAVDLMKAIPSLSVDINGNVSLRNSSPQIFVNGRPTILTLEQIPADDIDRVEVITNPSARYDAGSTGGIINIILKKNRKAGLNGVVSVGAGTPELFNSSLSLNYRKGKLNIFASGNYNQSGGIAKGEAKRQNKDNGIITDYFTQQSERERTRRFYSGRFGMDYMFNDFNSISISQGLVDGNFNNNEIQDQRYFDLNNQLTQTGQRNTADKFGFNRSNTQVNYKRTYSKPEKEWTADFTYSRGRNGGDAIIINQFYDAHGELSGTPNQVNNYSTGTGNQITIQTDYVNPLSENSKLELGARSYHNLSKDKLDVFSVDGSNQQKLPLSNNYRFREMINAVYANYSNKKGKLGYQGGLRIEQSSFRGELLDSAKSFGYDYPSKGTNLWNAVFPSLYLTYELTEGNDLQVNFSRRIRRPNFWQINPYVDISDPMNIRKGNPELQPEFTNSFELNYNRTFNTGNLLISGYFRNNTEDITSYSDTISTTDLQQLDNAAIDPNAILTTFINADRTNRMGVELTWQQRIGNSFDFTPNFNAQYRDVKARVNGLNLGNTGFNWNAKLMANYKVIDPDSRFLNNFSFQVSGEYESPRVMPQGKQKEQYYVDFAIRKDFLKDNAGTLTFNVNDLINTRRFGSITDTENFYQDSYRRWNVRTVRLTFSYRFGKNDFDLFKKRDGNGGNAEDERG